MSRQEEIARCRAEQTAALAAMATAAPEDMRGLERWLTDWFVEEMLIQREMGNND